GKALEILKANRDIGLVITDYNIPDIDGFELTRRIRANIGSHELRIIEVLVDAAVELFVDEGTQHEIIADGLQESCRKQPVRRG
ncbi:hypothetical protein ACC724_39055, partial [Rhizobium ruizarguesonis]